MKRETYSTHAELRESKYRKKHYDITEYHFFECECLKCGQAFQIDDGCCNYEYDHSIDEYCAVVFCPYCGTKSRRVI